MDGSESLSLYMRHHSMAVAPIRLFEEMKTTWDTHHYVRFLVADKPRRWAEDDPLDFDSRSACIQQEEKEKKKKAPCMQVWRTRDSREFTLSTSRAQESYSRAHNEQVNRIGGAISQYRDLLAPSEDDAPIGLI